MAMNEKEDDLNDAIQRYVGLGASPYPKEDEARVVDHYGVEAAQSLMSDILSIIADLQKIQPDWEKHTLISGSQWAVEQLSAKHPELTGKSKAALEWLYSWWWK